MKNNWQTKKIGDVAKICLGLTHTPKYVEDGIPFLSVKDISQGRIDFNNTRFITQKEFSSMPDGAKPQKDDILFCRVGTIGYPQIIKEDKEFGIFVSLGFFRAKKEIIFNKYLSYWMESPLFDNQVKKNVQGSTLKNLNTGWLKNFDILLPPIQDQKRIVRILDEVFEKIKKAKENTEKNLKNSHELFESYLQNVFNSTGRDWEEKKLREVCSLTRGHNPPKSKFIKEPKEGYIRFYQIRDGWSDDYATYVPDTKQLHKVTPDEFLMVAYRHIGKVFRGVSGAFNVALCKISNIRKDILNDEFLFYMIPTNVIKGELMKRSGRSLIPSMSVEHLKEILIPLPPLYEQKAIVKKLNQLSEQTKKLGEIYKQKLADLEELKKSILSKAFAGEI